MLVGRILRKKFSNVFRSGGSEAVNAPTKTSAEAKMLRLTDSKLGSLVLASAFISCSFNAEIVVVLEFC